MSTHKYINISFPLFSNFDIDEIKNVSYIKLYPSTTTNETSNIYITVYN